MPCSDPIIAMLAPFRPLFTAPTWKKMEILLRGPLLARGRRTVAAALRPCGKQAISTIRTLAPFTKCSIALAGLPWRRAGTYSP